MLLRNIIIYYKNKSPKANYSFIRAGAPHGHCIYYYKNGNKKMESEYENGVMISCIKYCVNGNTKEENYMKINKYLKYYENGNVKIMNDYKNNIYVGYHNNKNNNIKYTNNHNKSIGYKCYKNSYIKNNISFHNEVIQSYSFCLVDEYSDFSNCSDSNSDIDDYDEYYYLAKNFCYERSYQHDYAYSIGYNNKNNKKMFEKQINLFYKNKKIFFY